MRNQILIEVRSEFHEERALRRLFCVSACGLNVPPQAAKYPWGFARGVLYCTAKPPNCSSSRHPVLLSASRTVRVNRLVSLLVCPIKIEAGGEQKRPPVFRQRRGLANTGSRFWETARESETSGENGDSLRCPQVAVSGFFRLVAWGAHDWQTPCNQVGLASKSTRYEYNLTCHVVEKILPAANRAQLRPWPPQPVSSRWTTIRPVSAWTIFLPRI